MVINTIPDWLNDAVEDQEGRTLCKQEIFQSPDGSWAVWIWKDNDKPVLNLPSKKIAECVAEALHDAYHEGGESDYYYD